MTFAPIAYFAIELRFSYSLINRLIAPLPLRLCAVPYISTELICDIVEYTCDLTKKVPHGYLIYTTEFLNKKNNNRELASSTHLLSNPRKYDEGAGVISGQI